MNRKNLPDIVVTYIEGSNMHDMEMYLNAFSDTAIIEEKSIGRVLHGKEDIKHYFQDYFIDYNTYTEIIEYEVKENYVDMRVLFKGDFLGNKIIGLYKFFNEDGKIIKLIADLE
jgi:ketosteroid isomerase-like protein